MTKTLGQISWGALLARPALRILALFEALARVEAEAR
jgi:hypothetical protein